MIETAHALRVSISKPALKALSRCVRLHKRRVEFQTHAVCDGFGRPVRLFLTTGKVNNCKGAALLLHTLSTAKNLLVNRA